MLRRNMVHPPTPKVEKLGDSGKITSSLYNAASASISSMSSTAPVVKGRENNQFGRSNSQKGGKGQSHTGGSNVLEKLMADVLQEKSLSPGLKDKKNSFGNNSMNIPGMQKNNSFGGKGGKNNMMGGNNMFGGNNSNNMMNKNMQNSKRQAVK